MSWGVVVSAEMRVCAVIHGEEVAVCVGVVEDGLLDVSSLPLALTPSCQASVTITCAADSPGRDYT